MAPAEHRFDVKRHYNATFNSTCKLEWKCKMHKSTYRPNNTKSQHFIVCTRPIITTILWIATKSLNVVYSLVSATIKRTVWSLFLTTIITYCLVVVSIRIDGKQFRLKSRLSSLGRHVMTQRRHLDVASGRVVLLTDVSSERSFKLYVRSIFLG